MDNEQVTITLTVAQWNALLNALGQAPHIVVTSVMPFVDSLRAQAGAQIDEMQKNAAPEGPVSEQSAA